MLQVASYKHAASRNSAETAVATQRGRVARGKQDMEKHSGDICHSFFSASMCNAQLVVVVPVNLLNQRCLPYSVTHSLIEVQMCQQQRRWPGF